MTEEQDMVLQDMENGHAVVSRESAEKLCAALGQSLDPKIALTWQNAEEAIQKYGIFPSAPGPGGGVGMLELGYSLCYALGIDPPGRAYTGKGYQARANAKALREHFTPKNNEEEE